MGFIEDYFTSPMGYYYTIPGVLTYAVLFMVAAYIVYKHILKRFAIPIDTKFVVSLIPFIIFGGMTRALRDAEFYKGFLFVSPGIYLTVFLITSALLTISVFVQRKWGVPYWKTMLLAGSALVLFDALAVAMIGIARLSALYIFPAFFAAWGLAFFLIHKKLPRFMSDVNAVAMFSQMMDASQTFVAVTFFGYSQQMPMVSGLTHVFGAWVIFPVKLAITYAALLLIDKYAGNAGYSNWLKLMLIILGMPMGFRGMLRVAMGL